MSLPPSNSAMEVQTSSSSARSCETSTTAPRNERMRLAQLVYAFLIQIAGGFIEQKHRRILGKRAGQPAACLFPAAQPLARGGDGAELAPASRAENSSAASPVCSMSDMGRHAPHCAGIGRQSAGENAQECGFARAVRADQPHALAIVQRNRSTASTVCAPKPTCISIASNNNCAIEKTPFCARKKRAMAYLPSPAPFKRARNPPHAAALCCLNGHWRIFISSAVPTLYVYLLKRGGESFSFSHLRIYYTMARAACQRSVQRDAPRRFAKILLKFACFR